MAAAEAARHDVRVGADSRGAAPDGLARIRQVPAQRGEGRRIPGRWFRRRRRRVRALRADRERASHAPGAARDQARAQPRAATDADAADGRRLMARPRAPRRNLPLPPRKPPVKPLRIALLGCGTVGEGFVRLMRRNAAMFERRLSAPLELAGVADRSLKPIPELGIGKELIVRDGAALVERPEVDIVVELFGGHEPARTLALRALAAGKDVVTANKALLAEHGAEIFGAAAKAGLAIGFEASVGGGVPIIRTLREALAGDRQRAVYGIVNGTCNSILSTTTDAGREFADALAEAQRAGLAEADPTLDIDGHDAAHKLCLLVTLAFGVRLEPRQVYTEGIRRLTLADINFARELGYAVKLLAIA